MSDGRGPEAGSASGHGPNDPRRESQPVEDQQQVLEGRIIPAQPSNPLPPQRQPGQSGHVPGAYSGRPPSPSQSRHQLGRQIQQGQQAQQGQQGGQGGQEGQDTPPPSQTSEPAVRPHWEPPLPEQQSPTRQTPQPGLTPTFQPREERRRDEPDWAALADAQEGRSRKRRLLLIGAGVLAAAVVAAVVAVVVVRSDDGGRDGSETTDQSSSSAGKDGSVAPKPRFPEITPPPPPNPLTIISSAEKDTAPLSTDTLFPGKRLSLGDRAYVEGPTSDTKDCASVALNGLGPTLTSNDCRRMLRATYTREGISVTVGVAVFDTKQAADAVRKQASGHIAPLSGKNVHAFCQPVSCWSSTNAIGRYAYFTMAGFSNNTPVSSTDTKAKQSGRDVSTFAFRQILQRGKDAAGQ